MFSTESTFRSPKHHENGAICKQSSTSSTTLPIMWSGFPKFPRMLQKLGCCESAPECAVGSERLIYICDRSWGMHSILSQCSIVPGPWLHFGHKFGKSPRCQMNSHLFSCCVVYKMLWCMILCMCWLVGYSLPLVQVVLLIQSCCCYE